MAKIMKYQKIPSNIGLYIVSHDAGFLPSTVVIRFYSGCFAGRFRPVRRERRGATWYRAPNVSPEGVVCKFGVAVPKTVV